jgi:DNA topoisomerase-1
MKRRRVGPFTEPLEAARAAALRHVSDDTPGITRRRAGRAFSYTGTDGNRIHDREVLARIRALAIPPAWKDVWICPLANGHLQATGRDTRGRKQYRYHARWREVRDETKYGRMVPFGKALPRIRSGLRRHLRDKQNGGLSRESVLASIVRLLETTLIRVGNDEYARTNKSFGLTTMLDRHVHVAGPRIRFRFRGKGGKAHEIHLTDRRLASLVKKCRDLPGQDLFQYLDDAGRPQPVNSADVNEYLRGLSGEEFTAKDFRTWAGTLLAASELARLPAETTLTPKEAMLRAVESVAKQLGNTPAVCRKCYIHPLILEAFTDAALLARWIAVNTPRASRRGLSAEESALLRFLLAAPRVQS